MNSDLFFDQGEIVMELSGLKFAGTGHIKDKETGTTDDITMDVEMDLC